MADEEITAREEMLLSALDIVNKLKPVRCDNCKYFDEDVNYKGEGVCNKDGKYTREHRVCNKLPSDDDRRNAKLRRKQND